MMKFFFIFFLFFNCCYAQYSELEKCINNQCSKLLYIENLNLFDSISKYEDILVNSKILKDKTQRSYIHLIEKGKSEKFIKKHMQKVIKKYPFYYNFNDEYGAKQIIYNYCPYSVVSSSKEMSDKYYPVKEIYERFFAEGYPTNSILKDLICNKNFNNKVYRLMLCNLVFYRWQLDYKDTLLQTR